MYTLLFQGLTNQTAVWLFREGVTRSYRVMKPASKGKGSFTFTDFSNRVGAFQALGIKHG